MQNSSNVYNFQVDCDSIQTVFSIFDKKLRKYLPPFICVSEIEAKRQFSNVVNYTQSLMCKFPDDYCLYSLGSFNDITGSIVSYDIPFKVCEAKDLKVSDSVEFDTVKKEIDEQRLYVVSLIKDFEKMRDDFHKFYRESSLSKSDKSSESISLYQPVKINGKKSIIDRLFK